MFTPGTVVNEFTSKKGNKIVLRFASEQEAPLLTEYINTLSREDTFITFSGEQLSLESEQKFLKNMAEKIKKGDSFMLFGFNDDLLVSVGHVERLGKRSKHVGEMGISVKQEFRGEGIGAEMIRTMLEIAKRISLQMIQLTVFSPNDVAKRLYDTLGFNEVGKIPKKSLFHGELVDEIIMVKFL